MSFDYRFEPPTLYELEEMAFCECPYDPKDCENCEWDCDEREDEEC